MYQVGYLMESDCLLTSWPLLCEPPPSIPAALGTFLYPRNSDKLTPGRPAEDENCEISKARQIHEKNIFNSRKDPRYKKIRDLHKGKYSVNGKPYCPTCSETTSLDFPMMRVFFHTHVSSKKFRMEAALDHHGQYPCYSCARTPHTCKQGIRYPIILTASALNNWQKQRELNRYEGDEIHVDMIALPGATLDVLSHALAAEYGGLNRPIDVLVVAGLNDILRGATASELLSKYKKMESWVKEQEKYHIGQECSFAVATLPYPPMMVRLDGDHRPPLKEDKFQILYQANELIKTLNKDKTQFLQTRTAPQYHTWGVEKVERPVYSEKGAGHDAPHPTLHTTMKHKWSCWREQGAKNMLHLNNKLQFKMGRSAVNYFKVIYHIKDTQYAGKKEAEVAVRLAREEVNEKKIMEELQDKEAIWE